MSNVTLERHDGHLVAAKRADDHAKLSDEAELLSRLHHPGVVELVSLTHDDPPSLLTVWAGTDTWDRRAPTSTATAIHALDTIATTVSDLHSAGVTHRSLSPDHIIIANDGRPVLCGLGGAGPADRDGLEADRLGLRRLIEMIAKSTEAEHPGPLAELMECLNEPGANLRDFLQLINSFEESPSARPKGSEHRVMSRVALGLGFVAIAGVMWVWSPHRTQAPPSTLGSMVMSSPASSTTVGSFVTTTLTIPPAATMPTVDMATQPQQLVIEHAGRRYGIGAEGDSVVVGDWNCDGESTPALLQHSTGIVAVFDSWPEPGQRQSPRFTTVATDAQRLVSESVGDCDLLRARGPYGSSIITQESS